MGSFVNCTSVFAVIIVGATQQLEICGNNC